VVLVVVAVAALVAGGRTASGPTTSSRARRDPLTSSHAALDNQNNCNDCHVQRYGRRLEPEVPRVPRPQRPRARINAGKGFHASSGVKSKDCKTCHAEHKGRPLRHHGLEVADRR
jgi:hypothetical protein